MCCEMRRGWLLLEPSWVEVGTRTAVWRNSRLRPAVVRWPGQEHRVRTQQSRKQEHRYIITRNATYVDCLTNWRWLIEKPESINRKWGLRWSSGVPGEERRRKAMVSSLDLWCGKGPTVTQSVEKSRNKNHRAPWHTTGSGSGAAAGCYSWKEEWGEAEFASSAHNMKQKWPPIHSYGKLLSGAGEHQGEIFFRIMGA